MGELVGDDRVELLAAGDAQQPGRDDERGATRAAPDDERPREAVVDQAELRRLDLELRGEPVGRRAQQRILGERERARVEHPEQRAVTEPVDRDRGAQGTEREQRRASLPADQPAERRPREQRGKATRRSALRKFAVIRRRT